MSDVLIDFTKIWGNEAKSIFELYADGYLDQLVESSAWHHDQDTTEG
jgi:hypothetical protein